MPEAFDLENYLTQGVEDIVRGALKASISNPRQSAFFARYALMSRKASALRARAAGKGEHVPPFLIASVTTRCNLRCAGCYARAGGAVCEGAAEGLLSDAEWQRVFREAREMGVGFILLAGGEPLTRRSLLEAAGSLPGVLFPVFTNATLIDADYAALFGRFRNLIPMMSLEGGEAETDRRRGEGVYRRLNEAAALLKESGVLFGASATVTRENIAEVTSDAFLDGLRDRGHRVVIYVDYVPVEESTEGLAPGEAERAYLASRLQQLRMQREDILLIAFPGDELASGGCLAAGRGFFHINAHGGAEPCPFSPCSDVNVRDVPLREALRSQLFQRLRDGGLLAERHSGGCVLFEQREKVRLLQG